MPTKRVFVATQVSKKTKADFLAAISADFNGASDFFRRRINQKCAVERADRDGASPEKGFIALTVSVTPEQRAALLRQCEAEGVTMSTWMRNEIKAFLKKKK